MKCCRRYVSQTFAINTFRFAIFSSKKPFPTRVFIHRKFFNHFVNIFAQKKPADFFNIFQNKNTKMLTNFITKTFYYMTYIRKYKPRGLVSVPLIDFKSQILSNIFHICLCPDQRSHLNRRLLSHLSYGSTVNKPHFPTSPP